MPITRHHAAIAAASGVAVASLVLPAATASGAPAHHAAASASRSTTTSPAAAAAGYLDRQLVGKHHDHYLASYACGKKTCHYVNYGESADAVLSMDAAGVAQKAAKRATAYLEAHVSSYIVGSPTDYPGAAAKLLLVAEAQHVAPTSFGGVDLVKAITDSEGAGDAVAGEYQQNPGFPSSSYIVSQALPVLALANDPGAGAEPDNAAVSFLAKQACTDGGFQSVIRAKTIDACGDEDVDSTGYAVQALLAAGNHSAALAGIEWLKKAEHSNGGFGTPVNANSTSIAVEALAAAHRSITKPQSWLVHHQLGCSAPKAQRGAVAFEKGYDGSALLATSQAGVALAGTPLAWIDRGSAHGASPVLACTKKK